MAYLTTFFWGWLLGSVLLGFAMGWISVVQHGEGVSRKLRWWLSALVAALVVAALTRVVPGRFGYWLDLGLIASDGPVSSTPRHCHEFLTKLAHTPEPLLSGEIAAKM